MDYKEKYTREDALRDVRSFMGQLTEGCQDALKVLIPELRESEDERIRKALIEGVKQIRCKEGVTQEQMIAYLEKQKEPKDFPITDEEVKELLSNTPPVEVPEKYKTPDWLFEKQKEQEPIEWSKKDDMIIDAIYKHFKCLDPTIYVTDHIMHADILDWLENQKEQKPCGNVNVESEYDKGWRAGHKAGLKDAEQQKPAEWSERDDKCLASAISHVADSECFNHFYDITKEDIITWLKSLPERFSYQTK